MRWVRRGRPLTGSSCMLGLSTPSRGAMPMTEDARARAVRRYRRFAEEEAVETSPLYSALAVAVAEDDVLLDFLLALPEPKRQPNLLFAAVAFLHGVPTGPEELHARIRDDGDKVRATMLARYTQTNEPGRCSALLTALDTVQGATRPVRGGGVCRPVSVPRPLQLRVRRSPGRCPQRLPPDLHDDGSGPGPRSAARGRRARGHRPQPARPRRPRRPGLA